MAEKPKGGRGKVAPYESDLVRVPKDIKRHCHQLADAYREYLEDGGDPADLPDLPPDIFRKKPHVEETSVQYSHVICLGGNLIKYELASEVEIMPFLPTKVRES
jgi:hypothetical protein